MTPELRQSFVENFRANVRKVGELPLDYDHTDGPAPGWITDLRPEGHSLMASVRLSPGGRQAIQAGEYRFFSPQCVKDWRDPETGESHGPTLFGGALTNKPFLRGRAAVQCSEVTPDDSGGEEAEMGDADSCPRSGRPTRPSTRLTGTGAVSRN